MDNNIKTRLVWFDNLLEDHLLECISEIDDIDEKEIKKYFGSEKVADKIIQAKKMYDDWVDAIENETT